MNRKLSRLSSNELDSRLNTLVQQERNLLHEFLLHIQEVDRRRLYLKLAYPSLFEYLTRHLGYSAGAAQRRIDAARLGRQLPQVIEKIQTGELNLSQIAVVQQAARQCQKQAKLVSLAQTQALLSAIETKNSVETKAIVAKSLDLPVLQRETLRPQKDDSVRLELTLTAKQMADLERCRELLSGQLTHLQWAEVIATMCEDFLKRKDPVQVEARLQKRRLEAEAKSKLSPVIQLTAIEAKNPAVAEEAAAVEIRANWKAAEEARVEVKSAGELKRDQSSLNSRRKNLTSAAEVNSNMAKSLQQAAHSLEGIRPSSSSKSRQGQGRGRSQIANKPWTQIQTVPRPIKRHILLRQAHCQYKTRAGRTCGSRYRLQIDHIQPGWAGGGNDRRNLQVLCAAHNQHRYREQSGRN